MISSREKHNENSLKRLIKKEKVRLKDLGRTEKVNQRKKTKRIRKTKND